MKKTVLNIDNSNKYLLRSKLERFLKNLVTLKTGVLANDNRFIFKFITIEKCFLNCNCQDQQEGTQMQNERNKYLLKHKFRGGCTGGEQSWNYSKQRERTKPPEVDSLESSPSRYRWKIIHTRLGWQTAWGNQQAGSLRLVEQDWREHTVQTHNKTARKTTQHKKNM